ncbi:MAG: tRNA (adenosine(37)-N6)-threonylcarbamoyltransferase complex ATPase subunit type 1 TsaE [Planctomycetota bacterium]
MNLPLTFHLRDCEQTEQFGSVLGELLRSTSAHPGAIVVLLSGDLGAGKTTLVRGLANGLGADDTSVASPTFTLRMDHRGCDRPLVHIDAWRIGPGDLESIGFDELLAGNAVIAVEWPERLADALPDRSIRLRIEHAQALEIKAMGASAQVGELDEENQTERSVVVDAVGFDDRQRRRIGEGLSLLVKGSLIPLPCCPVCGKPPAGESSPQAPFCSPRCKLADLGDWLLMRHRIEGNDAPEIDE